MPRHGKMRVCQVEQSKPCTVGGEREHKLNRSVFSGKTRHRGFQAHLGDCRIESTIMVSITA
jgi:hypothetical protein